MSGDPLELSESDAQTAAEQDAEEADYRRYRVELLRRALEMPPHKVAELIEHAEHAERDRNHYRAALEDIARHDDLTTSDDAACLAVAWVNRHRATARAALEAPF